MSEEPSEGVSVCTHCWIPVKERTEGIKTWGKGEEGDERRWMHTATVDWLGNPYCGRNLLTDEELEPYSNSE